MSQQMLNLEEQVNNNKSPRKKGGSPVAFSPKIPQDIKGKYGAISDLENRLMDAERQNREL